MNKFQKIYLDTSSLIKAAQAPDILRHFASLSSKGTPFAILEKVIQELEKMAGSDKGEVSDAAALVLQYIRECELQPHANIIPNQIPDMQFYAAIHNYTPAAPIAIVTNDYGNAMDLLRMPNSERYPDRIRLFFLDTQGRLRDHRMEYDRNIALLRQAMHHYTLCLSSHALTADGIAYLSRFLTEICRKNPELTGSIIIPQSSYALARRELFASESAQSHQLSALTALARLVDLQSTVPAATPADEAEEIRNLYLANAGNLLVVTDKDHYGSFDISSDYGSFHIRHRYAPITRLGWLVLPQMEKVETNAAPIVSPRAQVAEISARHAPQIAKCVKDGNVYLLHQLIFQKEASPYWVIHHLIQSPAQAAIIGQWLRESTGFTIPVKWMDDLAAALSVPRCKLCKQSPEVLTALRSALMAAMKHTAMHTVPHATMQRLLDSFGSLSPVMREQLWLIIIAAEEAGAPVVSDKELPSATDNPDSLADPDIGISKNYWTQILGAMKSGKPSEIISLIREKGASPYWVIKQLINFPVNAVVLQNAAQLINWCQNSGICLPINWIPYLLQQVKNPDSRLSDALRTGNTPVLSLLQQALDITPAAEERNLEHLLHS